MSALRVQIKKPIAGLGKLPEFRENETDNKPAQKRYPAGSQEDLRNQIKILEKALQEAREEAFLAGFEEGKTAAMNDVQAAVEQLPDQFNQMFRQLVDQINEIVGELNLPILKLSKAIAQKILADRLELEEDKNQFLLNRIEQFLSTISEQSRYTIYVNPQQLDFLQNIDLMDRLQLGAHQSLRYRRKNALQPGECIIDSEDYHIDGTIARSLELISAELSGEH